MATVEDLPTGLVTGQFLFVSQDNADEGTAPNSVLVTGYVRFTCTATPPLLYKSRKILAVPLVADAAFDAQGHLVPLDPSQAVAVVVNGKLERGIALLGDSPDVSPRGFNWQVSFNLREVATGRAITIPPYQIRVSAGETIDLSEVTPVGQSNGVSIIRGESNYELAVSKGYTGTLEEWLESIKGEPGNDGRDGSNVIPTQDAIAAEVANPDSPVSKALEEQIIAKTAGAYAPVTEDIELDIWPAFNALGGDPDSWDARTYEPWIEGIDRKLGDSATKATVGVAPDGKPIYSYTTGRSTAPHVLLIGGTHGHELGGQIGAMRFFTEFATNPHPLMESLRAKARITYIPTLSASGYRLTRENSNGVDINRNWPWNWNYGASAIKGAAPLDQPEALAVKKLLDEQNIALLIDCHDNGPTSPEMSFAATSVAVHAHREIFATAAARWNATNPDAPAAESFTGDEDIAATLRNWGGKYLRWDKGRVNGASLLLEGRSGVGGSPANQLTRTGARWYASFIYKGITTWIEHGQTDAPYVAHKYWALQESTRSGTTVPRLSKDVSIKEGGRLIDTTTYTAVPFSYSSSGNDTNYIGFPIRHPGRYLLEWSANVELVGDTPVRVDGRVAGGPMPLDGSDLTNLATTSSGYAELKAKGEFASIHGRAMITVPAVPDDSFYMAQLFLRVAKAEGRVIMRDACGATVTVTPMPNFFPARQPIIKRPAEALPY